MRIRALLVCAPLLAFVLSLRPVDNFDLGFNLRIGEHVARAGIPVTDPFSYPGEGKPWALEQWLGPLAFWEVFERGGIVAVIVAKALVAALAIALVAAAALRAVRGEEGDHAALAGSGARAAPAISAGEVTLAAVASLLAAVAAEPRFLAQPNVLSLLGVAAVVLAVQGRAPLWLVPLFALWPHVHPGYLTGLAALGAAALADLSVRRVRTALVGLACAAACAASLAIFHPLHLAPLWHVLAIFGSPSIRASIAEFAPLWRSYSIGAPLLALALLPPAGWLAARRLPRRHVLLWALFVFSALRVGRLVGDAALVLAPVFADSLAHALRALRPRLEGLARLATPGRLAALPIAAAAIAAAGHALDPASRPLDWPGMYLPRECYAFLDAHPMPPRGFNDLWFGGSFIFHFDGRRKTFIDGRSFYSDEFFRDEYLPIRNAQPGWEKVAARWGVEWFLLYPTRFAALQRALRSQPDRYALVHQDAQCVVFRKR